MELRTPRFSCKLYDTMGRLLAAAYVSLIATSTIEAQTVLTVDDAPGPGVMYVGIQPAIDAAANGDILDIAPGSYSSFTIDGKSLTLVGSGSASTTVGGTTIVGNVPFGSRTTIHRMTLSKLQVGGTPLQSGDAVTTASFEEMSIDKVATVDAVRCDFSKSTMNQGLRVLNGDVVLSSCTVWMSLPGYGPPSLGIGSLNAAIYNGWDGSPGGPITIANTGRTPRRSLIFRTSRVRDSSTTRRSPFAHSARRRRSKAVSGLRFGDSRTCRTPRRSRTTAET
jgi:hypothetical protein